MFWHGIWFDSMLHSVGGILDISLPAPGRWALATKVAIRDVGQYKKVGGRWTVGSTLRFSCVMV